MKQRLAGKSSCCKQSWKINNILCSNASTVLSKLSDLSIHLTITSPPYDNLRTYGGFKIDIQSLIKSLYRVTTAGGVVVWVTADEVKNGSESGSSFKQALLFLDNGFKLHDTMIFKKNTSAFPARRTGNRYTQIFDYMFIFSKGVPTQPSLLCDKPNKWKGYTNWGTQTKRTRDGQLKQSSNIRPVPIFSPRTNIWEYVVSGFFGHTDKRAYEHPATFPEKLAIDHILTWSRPNDIILDPMCGSGTTCIAAKKLGRQYIGIDINKDYCKLSKQRLKTIVSVA